MPIFPMPILLEHTEHHTLIDLCELIEKRNYYFMALLKKEKSHLPPTQKVFSMNHRPSHLPLPLPHTRSHHSSISTTPHHTHLEGCVPVYVWWTGWQRQERILAWSSERGVCCPSWGRGSSGLSWTRTRSAVELACALGHMIGLAGRASQTPGGTAVQGVRGEDMEKE